MTLWTDNNYIYKNLPYPLRAQKNKVSGMVSVSFMINKDLRRKYKNIKRYWFRMW